MATKHYIPSKDADFANWLTNFFDYASTNAAALGLTVAQMGALQDLREAFDAAYAAHLVEVQTAKAKREAKQQTRAAAAANVRVLVKLMQANPAVTDEQRLALGITVPKSGKTPVPVPATRPVPEVERIEEFTHTLRLFDSETNKSAKPAGVEAAEVWMKVVPVGDPAPVDPSSFAFGGLASTNRVKKAFNPADAGKTCFYRLRWVNSKGQPGDWGPQVNATIAA